MSTKKGIPTEEEIRQDRTLSEQHEQAGRALSKHRWHMCADPTGPQYTQRVYAAAVGMGQSAISTSVDTWARALLLANPDLRGDQSADTENKATASEKVATAVAAGEEMAEPTQEQHDQGREQARYGTDKALLLDLIAKSLRIAPTTLTRNVNWKHWRQRGQELFDDYVPEMGVQAAAERAARDVAIEKRHHDDMAAEATRLAAEQESRVAGSVEVLNILIEPRLLMQRRRQHVKGDFAARVALLDEDQQAIVTENIEAMKAIFDEYVFTMMMSGS